MLADLEYELNRFQQLGLDGTAEALQRDILQGASQIANVIANGGGAAIAPALQAMGVVGAVAGIAPIAAGSFIGSPTKQFQDLAGQLSQLSEKALSLSQGSQVSNAHIRTACETYTDFVHQRYRLFSKRNLSCSS
jgi:hypothetical protein